MEFALAFITVFLPVIISTLALVLSVITMYLNRKRISVQFGGPIEALGENSVYCRDENGVFISSTGYGPGIHLVVEIINSSPCEISYFDLRAFDPELDDNYFLITRSSLPETICNKKLYRENPTNPKAPFHHNLPDAAYGMFSGRSYTYWNLFIIPREDSKNLRLSFRVSIKKLPFTKSDKYVTKNQKQYRFYALDLNISGWKNLTRMHLPLDMPLEDLFKNVTKPFPTPSDLNPDTPSQEQHEK
ncbi:hypothetical protein [Acetobacterium malicum]|uniref:hypothetical protein n=1 Tax=Acetobacterium malicum TaxID=52692 RepID=UPI00359441D1